MIEITDLLKYCKKQQHTLVLLHSCNQYPSWTLPLSFSLFHAGIFVFLYSVPVVTHFMATESLLSPFPPSLSAVSSTAEHFDSFYFFTSVRNTALVILVQIVLFN